MGQVWCLIVLIPDLCFLSYFVQILSFKLRHKLRQANQPSRIIQEIRKSVHKIKALSKETLFTIIIFIYLFFLGGWDGCNRVMLNLAC